MNDKENIHLSISDKEELERKHAKLDKIKKQLDEKITSLEEISTAAIIASNLELQKELLELNQSTESLFEETCLRYDKRIKKAEVSLAKKVDENNTKYEQMLPCLRHNPDVQETRLNKGLT